MLCLVYSSSYSSRIDSVIYSLYSFEFNKTLLTIDEMLLDYPEDPILPFLKVACNWQQSLINESPESSYDVINKGINEIEPFYNRMIEKYPENQNYRLYLGSLYGLMARVHLAESEYLKLIVLKQLLKKNLLVN